jgi:hypothetical protein
VQEHGHPALSESERASAPGDAAPDDDRVGAFPGLRTSLSQTRRSRAFVEPARAAAHLAPGPGADVGVAGKLGRKEDADALPLVDSPDRLGEQWRNRDHFHVRR